MSADAWGGEKMTRSDAQRRYQNLVTYQLRPMLTDKHLEDDARVGVLKRVVREAARFRYESGVVAGSGIREEVVDLVKDWFLPERAASEELKDWFKRAVRAFGATIGNDD